MNTYQKNKAKIEKYEKFIDDLTIALSTYTTKRADDLFKDINILKKNIIEEIWQIEREK